MFPKFNLNLKPLILTAAVASALMLGSVAFADTPSKGATPPSQEQQAKTSPDPMIAKSTQFPDLPPAAPTTPTSTA